MSFLHAGVWGGLELKKNGLFGLAGVFDRFAAIQTTITAPIPNIQRSAIRQHITTSAFDFHVFYDCESRLLLIRSETVLSPLGSLGGKFPSGGFSFGCALSWPELLEFICASEPIREEFSPSEELISDSVAAATAIAPLMPVVALPAKAVMPAEVAARPAENAPLNKFEPTEFPVAIAL
ncbi:MAG: hypothetical protein WBW41_04180 [Verrucomicrobiia bacterium]